VVLLGVTVVWLGVGWRGAWVLGIKCWRVGIVILLGGRGTVAEVVGIKLELALEVDDGFLLGHK